MSTRHLSISDVSMRFAAGTPEVLLDVRLEIARGAYVALIGHSGCGTSTLLNIVAGLRALRVGSGARRACA